MKQKLFILDPSKDITGAFMCAKNEAKILKDNFEITLVMPSISKIDTANFQDFNQVIRLPIYDMRKSFFSILIYFPALLLSGYLLKSKMKKENCTLLQVNDYYMMQGVCAKLFGYEGKIFTWVRIDHRSYGSIFSKYWLKYTYKTSDKIIAVSNFIKSTLPNSEKNILLYDPVCEMVAPKKETTPQDKRKIVFIANYTYGKGQQYAIKAFSPLANKHPDAELHFYGGTLNLSKNLAYKNELISQVKNENLEDKIFFHSFTDNVVEVLNNSYMALNFSESESFSMTCLEASSAGLGVIATKCGGPEEIIVDNATGFLVEKANIAEMTLAIDKLLSDRSLAHTFGENGRNYVYEKFSQDVFKTNLLRLFGEDK